MKKNIYFYSNLLAWGLVLFLTTNHIFGWTTPTEDPPGGNITPSFSQWTTSGSDIYYNTGNVGIGVVSPGSELHIGGTTPQVRIGDDGAEDTSLVFMGNAQDFYIALDDTTDDLTIGTGTTIGSNVRMVVEYGGNVGIGTITPGEKLEVSGNIKLSGASPTYKITNLAEPTANSDAATKGYVDTAGGEDGFNLCTIDCYSSRYNTNFISCNSGWNTFYNKTSYGCNNNDLVVGSVNIGSSTSYAVERYYPVNSYEYKLTLNGQYVHAQCRNTRNNWNAYAQVIMCCTRNI